MIWKRLLKFLDWIDLHMGWLVYGVVLGVIAGYLAGAGVGLILSSFLSP